MPSTNIAAFLSRGRRVNWTDLDTRRSNNVDLTYMDNQASLQECWFKFEI